MDNKNKKILNEYLDNISVFYTMIAEWLKDKSLFCKEIDYNVNEKASGQYTAKKLVILKNNANPLAEIFPVGAWVIGANGRIDLIGDFDQQILIYLKKDLKRKDSITIPKNEEHYGVSKSSYSLYKRVEQDGWYWIENKRLGKAHAVNKELFFDLLAEVSDHES